MTTGIWGAAVFQGVELPAFNMAPHHNTVFFQHSAIFGCARNGRCQTASAIQKQRKPKKQPPTVAVLWCRKNHHTHKERKQKPNSLKTALNLLQAKAKAARN